MTPDLADLLENLAYMALGGLTVVALIVLAGFLIDSALREADQWESEIE
jgi:hypothetical protein